ncbi:MAG: thermonuclease family protein [Rhodospirillaceae bacterium]|nr:thermonuclease family protein [Rhodospirillaceae bacterium]
MRPAPILFATCIALSVVTWATPVRADVSGWAEAIDGDTIVVAGTRIRLFGIDAPERLQVCQAGGELWLCGGLAKLRLQERLSGHTVVCEERDRDRHGRIVAVCRAGGEDLNAWMVSQGWALAYRKYSEAYVDEEARAESARAGVWRGEFVPPWDWRGGKRLPSARVPRDAPRVERDCRIKGNISRYGGQRIYHVSGGFYYDRTRIDPSKGERWFCSEAEARAAGWRKSRR